MSLCRCIKPDKMHTACRYVKKDETKRPSQQNVSPLLSFLTFLRAMPNEKRRAKILCQLELLRALERRANDSN